MKRIRIGAGLGFYGDSWQPVRASIERGGVHYIASDHLAELTLAILQKDRQRDASLGYTRDLRADAIELWPLAAPRGVHFVINAGGLNPRGARAAVAAAFARKGWRAKIATVTRRRRAAASRRVAGGRRNAGPSRQRRAAVARCASGSSSPTPISAPRRSCARWRRAPTSSSPAASPMRRCSSAPLVHEFGWALATTADRPRARGSSSAICSNARARAAAATSARLGAGRRSPDPPHIGYPIAEVSEDGDALHHQGARHRRARRTSTPCASNCSTRCTTRARYLSPDVVLDMDALRLDDLGADRVRVRGASGHARPERLKIVAGYDDGWMGQCRSASAGPTRWPRRAPRSNRCAPSSWSAASRSTNCTASSSATMPSSARTRIIRTRPG